MKRYINEKIDAWKEHGDRFTCQHKVRELRTRIVKGGAKQYVYQCQGCGEAQMQPVARAKAYDLYDGQEPPPFDDTLPRRWDQRKSQSVAEIQSEFTDKFWTEYSAYLQTPEWAARRRLVLERANGLCEGCRKLPATDVHHLTYEHMGEEFLFELVALCGGCHSRLHASPNATTTP